MDMNRITSLEIKEHIFPFQLDPVIRAILVEIDIAHSVELR